MLIVGSAFLAWVRSYSYRVSRPHIYSWSYSSFSDESSFPCAGETWCKMLPVHTLTNTRLINSDLDSYVPMMISRMIISLKKVACKQETPSSVDVNIIGSLPMHSQYSCTPHPVESIQLVPLK